MVLGILHGSGLRDNEGGALGLNGGFNLRLGLVFSDTSASLSHLLFPKTKKEIRRVLICVAFGSSEIQYTRDVIHEIILKFHLLNYLDTWMDLSVMPDPVSPSTFHIRSRCNSRV